MKVRFYNIQSFNQAEWLSHGKNCDGVKSVSGAGGTMGPEFGTVSDVCRDDLLKQPNTDGQANTHWVYKKFKIISHLAVNQNLMKIFAQIVKIYEQAQLHLVHILIQTMQVRVVIPEQIPKL